MHPISQKFMHHISCLLSIVTIRGGDCNQAFLSHRECVCYDRCPRCSVEFELDVNFDKVNPTRPDQERGLALTVTSKDLVSVTVICHFELVYCYFHFHFSLYDYKISNNTTGFQ